MLNVNSTISEIQIMYFFPSFLDTSVSKAEKSSKVVKPKSFRMRMYADDEELKTKTSRYFFFSSHFSQTILKVLFFSFHLLLENFNLWADKILKQ